jgi:asparagine synthetase B (glutamine-hydrolysing)
MLWLVIGIHVNTVGATYSDHHANLSRRIGKYSIALSYHDGYDRQVTFEDSRHWVLVDGWIFNSPSYDRQAEWVLELFRRHGTQLPYHLDGQFNILIADKQAASLYICTDIFSFRKHYVHGTGADLIFSSDQEFIVSLLKEVSVNREHISRNLSNPRYLDIGQTFYREISAFPPRGVLDTQNNRQERYDLSAVSAQYDSAFRSDADLLDRMRAGVRQAHRGPVLLELSGGLDSRFLLELFRDAGLDVRTIAYGTADSDETRLARRVADANRVPHHEVALKPGNFLAHASRHMKQTGGMDIFVQSAVHDVLGPAREVKDLSPRVIDTGFALDAFLGGSQLDARLLVPGDLPLLSRSEFSIRNAHRDMKEYRLFSALAIRQSLHREYFEDRYAMYGYRNFFSMDALEEDRIRDYALYYRLALLQVTRSADVPLQSTLFGLDLDVSEWKAAREALAHRERFTIDHFRRTGRPIYHNRYYSDFEMWLRGDEKWKELVADLLLRDDSLVRRHFIERDYVRQTVRRHLSAEASRLRDLVKWMSIEMFLRGLPPHVRL